MTNGHHHTKSNGSRQPKQTASFVSEELADNLAALGWITRTKRQIRLLDERCDGIYLLLKVEVKFGNKHLTMNRLILPGVVDPLVLG